MGERGDGKNSKHDVIALSHPLGDDSSLWMPVGDIPEGMTASEYLPQEELIMGDGDDDRR